MLIRIKNKFDFLPSGYFLKLNNPQGMTNSVNDLIKKFMVFTDSKSSDILFILLWREISI